MRKNILLILFISIGAVAHSQVIISLLLGDKLNSEGLEFGLETGINYSSITGLEGGSYIRKLNIGFYFDIRLKNQWYIYTGTLVKSNVGGGKLSENDLEAINSEFYGTSGSHQQVIGTFQVPVLLNYKFKNHIYLELGPQFGLMHGAHIEYNAKVDDREVTVKNDNESEINRIDAGIVGGAGYQLLKGKGLTIGARYYYGFVDVYKEVAGTKNSSLFLKVNIPVGAKKKNKKLEEE